MNRKHAFLKRVIALMCCFMMLFLCTACMQTQGDTQDQSAVPQIPGQLKRNEDGVPLLNVYNTDTESISEMDLETYIMGVVAGEMKNTWPMEALEAQAILARTFTMKFLSTKDSQYDGADISTDVTEAQAYNADAINDRVREAVNKTRGIVMNADGEFPYAWFHAHSGGKTELPTKALEYNEDPDYLRVVASKESEKAPDEVKNWTATFTRQQVQQACKEAGVETGDIESFTIGERGESGRAVSFLVNGKEVSAPTFRLRIGASKLKSTLIDSVQMNDGQITFTGSGFGHGVGMSQWGAYAMAEEDASAEEIIEHYFYDIEFSELW